MNLSAFRQLLGDDNVKTDRRRLDEAEAATFPTANRVPAVLRAGSTEEVRDCLRLAASQDLKVFPISRGKNWGYGSSVPFADGCLLLDLSRMNRILDFDEKLGYVVVEPGVTQQQLSDFLEAQGGRLWMDASGATPESSIVGNALERGFGHTPYSDHFANVCCLQVVLASGEVMETGLGPFGDAKAKHVYRWGVGPSLDGLFSQSRLGVVTRMTVWLMPKPEAFAAFFLKCEDPAGLPRLVETLRDLRQAGVLQSSVHIVNGYRVLAGLQQYPWALTGGETPLPDAVYDRLRIDIGFGHWNGSGGIYGPAGIVRETRKLLQRALNYKQCRTQFVNDRLLRIARRYAGVLSPIVRMNLKKTLTLLEPAYALLQGRPTSHALHSVYWRQKMGIPAEADLHRDGCGLVWVAPVAPADGGSAREVVAIAEQSMREWGFEPMISLTLASPRALICVISILYDRGVPGEDERAMCCSRTLNQRLAASGYQPYRLGLHTMESWGARTHSDALLRLQEAMDPKGILSPGHYDLA